ncbi:MAG: site-specific DNA-methyltransferase [Verrucomicrobia bacterium]|nr:MAG: site-specific DNA-methyltransferase [Verrucomicrobiota bacterium]
MYIDPPYNTGNEGWIYNDKVNSPEINKWLGQTVGKEAEDLSRHDKWLCMMYPRLVLLKQFLREDGAIFVSIDDNEVASLRLLMDEIFGARNFVTNIAWQKIYTVKNSAKHFSEMHDHIVCYASSKNAWERNLIPRSDEAISNYTNQDNDSRGLWSDNALQARNRNSAGIYPIKCPGGRLIEGPPEGTYWRMSETKFWELDADNRVWWGKDKNNAPRIKKFLKEAKEGVVPSTWWKYQFAGTNSGAKTELREILKDNSADLFNTPKPWQLIRRIIQIATDDDSIILDSFAGSGSTAHAVLKQNLMDGGSRRFILCEMDQTISSEVTAERIRRVCEGYSFEGTLKDTLLEQPLTWNSLRRDGFLEKLLTDIDGIKESGSDQYDDIKIAIKGAKLSVIGEQKVTDKTPGLGSGFQFCRLSAEPLFNEFGDIRDDVTFAELADFVWFAETGVGYSGAADSPMLGTHEGRAIVLLFNGILGDRRPQGGNILTKAILNSLPAHDGPKVIYAAATRLGASALQRANVIFKQTPYAIEV